MSLGFVKRLVKSAAKACIALPFDLRESSRDRLALIRKRHQLAYAEHEGEQRTAAPSRAAILAICPNRFSLPFTINLLNGFAANGFYTLAITSGRLSQESLKRLLPHCSRLIERYPLGRDFGMYQYGLAWLERQSFFDDLDVIAVANDSLYYSQAFGTTIRNLLLKNGDWLGLYESFSPRHHVQSFFEIFRKPVFRSKAFIEYWRKYKPYSSRRHSISNGELGLSSALLAAGFTPEALYNSVSLWQALQEKLASERGVEEYAAITSRVPMRFCGYTYHRLAVKAIRSWSSRSEDFAEFNESAEWGRPEIPYSTSLDEAFTQTRAATTHRRPKAIAQSISPLLIDGLISSVAKAAEMHNPTHAVGLLLNYLHDAPLKRDLCYRQTHTISELTNLAEGFTPQERLAMQQDLRAKGLDTWLSPYRKLLSKCGRI